MCMEHMTELTKKVLEFLEPDSSKWEYWISEQSLNAVSESKCMESFKERVLKAVSNHVPKNIEPHY